MTHHGENSPGIRAVIVVGARPNFMKAAPILHAMAARGGFRPRLVHTGQHYDERMSDVFFRELEMPAPDVNLGVGSGSHGAQTAEIMIRFEPVLAESRPDIVLVVGDVNSTVACSLVAVKLGIKVGHVEAGLRSGDRSMPEELNRIVTDAVSDLLFTTEAGARANLLREGRPAGAIHFVGNTMIDTLLRCRARAERSPILERLGLGADPRPYAVLTLHRPSTVDEPRMLEAVLDALHEVARTLPIIFPIHPRTARQLGAAGLGARLLPLAPGQAAGPVGLHAVPPLGYLDFLKLMSNARLVLTDSGGIQEETTILGVPCLTLRDNTERPATIEHGTNVLVGRDPARIIAESRRALARPPGPPAAPPLWDGRAAERIVDVLATTL
ncbi:MAG TPA: UDP-N-acetylglucosamine 2-epimerase (non-hydrolyzing) [Planctomycetota bacterium]|nr:UDP-N-acetylglucosamine 2-epimerase (non-hydrolyzing) [Planctomycetota bacterium]HRR78816.1 UDP-N-acetylglucosamine 2-epimerase (non-hydrolyzing) [Planctomycetota bacterium]HRT92877.1 UDP-N-acetylglucosamine 2-epimerase (non-hydrolyzing) [Planctomycetota bacterium]